MADIDPIDQELNEVEEEEARHRKRVRTMLLVSGAVLIVAVVFNQQLSVTVIGTPESELTLTDASPGQEDILPGGDLPDMDLPDMDLPDMDLPPALETPASALPGANQVAALPPGADGALPPPPLPLSDVPPLALPPTSPATSPIPLEPEWGVPLPSASASLPSPASGDPLGIPLPDPNAGTQTEGLPPLAALPPVPGAGPGGIDLPGVTDPSFAGALLPFEGESQGPEFPESSGLPEIPERDSKFNRMQIPQGVAIGTFLPPVGSVPMLSESMLRKGPIVLSYVPEKSRQVDPLFGMPGIAQPPINPDGTSDFGGQESRGVGIPGALAPAAASKTMDQGRIREIMRGTFGKLYKKGGVDPEEDGGLSAGGLVKYIYREAGFTVPRVIEDQMEMDWPMFLSKGYKPQIGDVLFFRIAPGVNHVGVYYGRHTARNEDVFITVVMGKGGVIVVPRENEWFKERFLFARRILKFED